MSLPTTRATTATTTHAVVQALETYIQNQNLLGEIAELDDMLYDLVAMHKDNELALKRVLQCIHNLLQTNSKYNVRFGPKVFLKLVSVVIADSREDSASRRQLVANLLVCVQLHIRKFPRIEAKFVLQQLWSLSQSNERQPHAAQILVHLFDDFVNNLGMECAPELLVLARNLLQSDVRDDRRSAYFLMRKLQEIEDVLAALQCSEVQWSAYVGIMENLEEQQSHLVLPTLSTLLPRMGLMSNNLSEDWLGWLRILCIRLLGDNNILVLRWTLKYFLSHFSLEQISRFNLLIEFLSATNRTQLYNPEVPDCLTKQQISDFVAEFPAEILLEALVCVPWHAVPLIHWLQTWELKQLPVVSKELLFQLGARVRSLQNTVLRGEAINYVVFSLSATIESLSLGDDLLFMESLYNTIDRYQSHSQLADKINKCTDLERHIANFNIRCCELVSQMDYKHDVFVAFLDKLGSVPKAKHGWWRLLPIFLHRELDHPEKYLDFYRSVYNVDTSFLESGVSLEQMQQHLLDQLECQTREEKSFVREHSVDLFVKINLPTWSKLEDLNLNPLELLDQGTEETFTTLSNTLSTHDKPLADKNVLAAFISRLGKLKARETQAILKYAVKNLSPEEYEKCVVDVLQKNTFLLATMDCEDYIKAPTSFVIKKMVEGETTTGDARIERAFEQISDTGAISRAGFIHYAKNSTGLDISSICDELLKMNNDLSRKKPRYFANCKEHRMKMRIGKALLDLSDRWKWSENLWEAALCPSDQPNISFMYEYLVAKMLPSIEPLLEQLKLLGTLKPSQQISLVSVVHIYCLSRWESINHEQLFDVFAVLLPLTMGANFQTRLLAQLVLHRLCNECDVRSIQIPVADALKKSIEVTLGEKLNEFQSEARLLLPEIGIQCTTSVSDAILWMTSAPFDENIGFVSCSYAFRMKLSRALETFKRKQSVLIPELASPLAALNGNVQRKMNPVGDIYPESDFDVSSKARVDHELIVVASLIDKLPNLGGLARTCEVLGVKTLILGLKSQAEKSDFTNLSMTAEKTLNILEVNPESLAGFLLEKQMEGYKIVGAEQTAHSTNFVDFKFPKKSILLLGHEKHGIPANLIGFLDYAVEIPQYGLVRSLNVHVAGSLFIWEYCKQHLTKE
ncbi:uncharacterized protein LOC6537728 isoform X1 [Drosophila yakuba]|uniref:tRNA (guanosine(18)-2'-O)-methyltransferase TARBP1 n=1 Tax=Drosophila yakuba TaxID=7245 RepID=B4PLN6_DROYA|nr:uncharacterized protein LOC6537728 isoform X1 [Drosophila yakuba]EDW97985.1 uncharacterized protein Dyak_GE10291, isoform A [Drosophila yakuba]